MFYTWNLDISQMFRGWPEETYAWWPGHFSTQGSKRFNQNGCLNRPMMILRLNLHCFHCSKSLHVQAPRNTSPLQRLVRTVLTKRSLDISEGKACDATLPSCASTWDRASHSKMKKIHINVLPNFKSAVPLPIQFPSYRRQPKRYLREIVLIRPINII